MIRAFVKALMPNGQTGISASQDNGKVWSLAWKASCS
jgi:hypothetical protein